MQNEFASESILIFTAGLLFWMALSDLRAFKIRNNHVLALTALFLVHAAVSGRWVFLHWNFAFAAAMGTLLIVAYRFRLLGGGDVKLLTVAFLWSGYKCAVPFLVVVGVASVFMIIAAHMEWIRSQRVNGRLRLAFAPAIASGLIAIFLMGCLTPI